MSTLSDYGFPASGSLPGTYTLVSGPAIANTGASADETQQTTYRIEVDSVTQPNHLVMDGYFTSSGGFDAMPILGWQSDGSYYAAYINNGGAIQFYHVNGSTFTAIGAASTAASITAPGNFRIDFTWTSGGVLTASMWSSVDIGDIGTDAYRIINAFTRTDTGGTAGAPRITATTGKAGFLCKRVVVDRIQFTDAASSDTTPPTLTSATGTGGTLSATGTVSVNEIGTLWSKCSTAATETVPSAGGETAAGWTSQSISSTGTQSVNFGTQAAGARYAHYFAVDAAGNRSARSSAGPFTVTSGGDTTPPVLSSPTGTGGTLTATGTVSVNELGTLWSKCDTASTATDPGAGSETSGGWASQTISSTGAQSINFGTQTAGTKYAHYFAVDAAGNRSSVANSSSFSVTGSAPGTYTAQFGPGFYVTGSGPQLAKSADWYVWVSGSDSAIGTTLPTTGSGVCDSNGRWTATGLPASGAAMVLAFDEDGGVYFERVTAG